MDTIDPCPDLPQDNKSTILLETNGKVSNSSRTNHIKSKQFFVTDKVEQGEEAEIEYKPTGQMWIDINTKRKEGTAYKTDRLLTMNCPIHLPHETLPNKPVSILRSKQPN